MTHILITDLREIRYMAYVPEEPKYTDHLTCGDTEVKDAYYLAISDYQSALEKAKRESLPFDREEDRELAIKLIRAKYMKITDSLYDVKPGIYQVPVEVEIVEMCAIDGQDICDSCVCECRHDKEPVKVARLKSSGPSEFAANRKFERFIQSDWHESQEFSGKEVGTMVWDKEAGIVIKPLEESQEVTIRDLLADYRALEKTGSTHYAIELILLDKFNVTRKRG